MNRILIRFFLILSLVISPVAWADNNAPFPDLVDINGKPVTSEANLGNGKWQLVMIWSTDCHICTKMKPILSAFHDKHKDDKAQVYGVALDGRENLVAVQKYMIEHEVSFPTYIGELDMISINFEINNKEPLRGTPTYLLFNPSGELVAMDYGMLDTSAIERFMERNG